MSVLPCPNQIGCDSDYPVSNYSSEDADPRSFIGYSTGTAPTSSFTRGGGAGPRDGGPDKDDTGGGVNGADGTAQTGTGGDPPPLGSDYDNATVTTFAESTESQAAANNAAGNDNVSAMTVSSNTGEPGGGIILNPSRLRPPVFGNDPQQCSVTCPDGQQFSYTVAANFFKEFSKAKANAAARSEACRQAAFNRICLGGINPNATVGELYDQSIIADTVNIPVTFVIISGDIPTWADAHVSSDRVQLIGTPSGSDVGSTNFTIQATDAFGNVMTRAYTITVSAGAACNPSASAAVQVIAVNAGGSVYCNKTDTVFSIESTSSTSIVEYSTSGVAVGGILIGNTIEGIFYENTNQRIYVTYRVGVTSTRRIASYNPSTKALVNVADLSIVVVSSANANFMAYDSLRNNIWVAGTNYVWKINANTLSQSLVQIGVSFSGPRGMTYCSNQDRIVITGRSSTPQFCASVWNPVSMAFTVTDIGTGATNTGGDICYNSNNGLVYATYTPDALSPPGQLVVFDPLNVSGFVTVDLPTSDRAICTVYNSCTDKVVVAANFSSPIKAYYIEPSNNTIAATLTVGASYLVDVSPFTYDSTNARMWLGVGNALLKFT